MQLYSVSSCSRSKAYKSYKQRLRTTARFLFETKEHTLNIIFMKYGIFERAKRSLCLLEWLEFVCMYVAGHLSMFGGCLFDNNIQTIGSNRHEIW